MALVRAVGVLVPHTNTFGFPNVPSEPCLLLCPQAFAAPALTSPKQLGIEQETRQQEIPWKDAMGELLIHTPKVWILSKETIRDLAYLIIEVREFLRPHLIRILSV